MSTQICKIKGFGYKFDYDEPLFSFIPDKDKEYDFLDIVNKNFGYYSFRNYRHNDSPDKRLLSVVIDGMGGEYKYVLYIEKVEYVDNTHFDDYWELECRCDDWVKERAKNWIETFLQRKLDTEPQMFEFKHWN